MRTQSLEKGASDVGRVLVLVFPSVPSLRLPFLNFLALSGSGSGEEAGRGG